MCCGRFALTADATEFERALDAAARAVARFKGLNHADATGGHRQDRTASNALRLRLATLLFRAGRRLIGCRLRFDAGGDVTTVRPRSVAVSVGNLEIRHDGQSGRFAAGYGAKVNLDGKPFRGVRSITLRVPCDDVIEADVTFLPSVAGEG